MHMLEAGHGIPPELKLHAHVSCLACVRELNPPQEQSVLLTTKLSLQAPAVKTLSKYYSALELRVNKTKESGSLSLTWTLLFGTEN